MFFRKNRTKLKKWLDRQGIEQQELAKKSKVSVQTISKACRDREYIPKPEIMKKLLNTIRKIDPHAKINDFWDM
ncbi:helix-turn-helix transcriptional regulator [Bacillus cereus]|uniref:helix-turn-helix domain-containing protein n=1 Tax=Bacillus TaxID=1386 RepID=UPI0007AC20DD|nr:MULTISPECIES: helix-turn-helix transcriptional regulator [Bacillus]KZD51613.1 Transcriptional regulator Xre family [Bacillus cereus]MCU5149194.1 helix-turn-helix transcriptional regulator [Bacillus cereus]MCU5496121.1 helix-turn-helix transcriptional regulator [Bacillus cereus]MCU5639371.1 helix-turn-helix transcriptional regulator [Bacillus cereus]MEB9844520.1 helix-turn-helix transcriptional regulator [Bacillus cereus]